MNPFKKLHAEQAFEELDLVANSGRRNVKFCRCCFEAKQRADASKARKAVNGSWDDCMFRMRKSLLIRRLNRLTTIRYNLTFHLPDGSSPSAALGVPAQYRLRYR